MRIENRRQTIKDALEQRKFFSSYLGTETKNSLLLFSVFVWPELFVTNLDKSP